MTVMFVYIPVQPPFYPLGLFPAPLLSLMKSMMASKGKLTRGEERETVGVSVQGYQFTSGTDVRFYDLAGQVDYYGLHQLFLTETALYVLVWDAWKYRNRTEV